MPRKYAGPLLPGQRSAYVRTTRKNRSYRRKTPLVKKIKAVSLAQCETKTASQTERSVTLYHNLTHYVPNLLACNQGVTNNPGNIEQDNRIGNEVVARGLKLRLQWITSPQRPNFNMRFYVFRYETGSAPSDAMFWSGPSGAGANQNRMIDFPHSNNVTILKSFLIQNRNTIYTTANTVHNEYRDVWIPMNNKKIKYVETDSNEPKYTTIGMCCVCYDANNTLQTDALAYWSYTTKFYYKDP